MDDLQLNLNHCEDETLDRKYGRQLLTDYRSANERVQRLRVIRQGSLGSSLLCLSTSPMSVQLHRKSAIDMLDHSQSSLSAAESTSSLVNNTDSPSVIQRMSPEHSQAFNSPNGTQTHSKHVNWGRLGHQSPSPVLFRSRHSAGGCRTSADYTLKPDSSGGLKQPPPHRSLNDMNNEVSHLCRLPSQVYSMNSHCSSPRLMNGNHILPSGVARPRL